MHVNGRVLIYYGTHEGVTGQPQALDLNFLLFETGSLQLTCVYTRLAGPGAPRESCLSLPPNSRRTQFIDEQALGFELWFSHFTATL